jgi:ABC-type Fe3+/spermidine/putrescine transport system ATPase subunit
MAKIVIRNLTKTYSGGDVVALQDINLEVEPYESLCILGPSGCGKTTLLRIIDCLISRDRGEIIMDGTVITQPRPDVAMVFQHFGLFPWKRLDQNIAYGLALKDRPKRRSRPQWRVISNSWASRNLPSPIRISSPAACSSAPDWRARWRSIRR